MASSHGSAYDNRQVVRKIIADEYYVKALASFVADTDFDENNLASILSRAGTHLGERIEILVKNQARLASIIARGPFAAIDISTILGLPGWHLANNIDVLVAQNDRLAAIAEKGPFSAQHIASMLNSAGGDLADHIEVIAKYSDAFGACTDRERAAVETLASMFHSARKDLKADMQAVLSNKEALATILAEGPFKPAELVRIFQVKHGHFDDCINAISTRLPELRRLCDEFSTKKIANKLQGAPVEPIGTYGNKVSSIDMGSYIDNMYKKALPLLNATVNIPAGSNPAIAAGSTAAQSLVKVEL